MPSSVTLADRPAAATRPPVRRHPPSSLSRYLFVLPAVIYLVMLMFYPLSYTSYLSLFDVNVTNYLSGTSQFIGLQNYVKVLTASTFLPSLTITFAFTVGSLLFQHTIGFAFALFFNKGFPLSGLLRSILLVVWVMPAVVSASLWRWMFAGSFGLINAALGLVGIETSRAWLVDPRTALLAVVVANIWVGVPFHLMLLFAGLQTIPKTLYEATSIDGASRLQQFWYVTVPMMRPVIITALLLGFVHTFKAFDIIYVLTGGGPANATNVLSNVYRQSFEYFQLGQGAAAANVLLIIPLLLSVLYLWIGRRKESDL